MVIAITGSQGSGKSTILKELNKLGFNSVEGKVARSILTDWDITLAEVYADTNLTMEFQDEVLTRKYQETLEHCGGDQTVFVERTFADIFTYCLLNVGRFNEYNEWFDEYFNTCKTAQQHIDLIFYLPANQFSIEHDMVRSTNQYYGNAVDMVLKHYLQSMSSCPIITLDCLSIDERISTILSTAESMNFNLQ